MQQVADLPLTKPDAAAPNRPFYGRAKNCTVITGAFQPGLLDDLGYRPDAAELNALSMARPRLALSDCLGQALAFPQHLLKFLCGHRAAEEITLHLVASVLLQVGYLLFGFDAFCDDSES